MTKFLRLMQLLRHTYHAGIPKHFFAYRHTPSPENAHRLGQACAQLLTQSGPFFIKLGQMLATRNDVFPDAFLTPLRQLHEQLLPASEGYAQTLIEQAFGEPIHKLFAYIELRAIACASIAQVHFALMPNGQAVAVKILRPHVRTQILENIDVMRLVARWIHRIPSLTSLRAPEAVALFERTLLRESDLSIEAEVMHRLAQRHTDDWIKIPRVIWPYVTSEAYIMSYHDGARLPLQNPLHGIYLKPLAKALCSFFLTELFGRHGFHGDLHCGNVLIHLDGHRSSLILLDFGITGTLSLKHRYALYRMLQALLKANYEEVARLHHWVGWVPEDTDLLAFSSQLHTALEPLRTQSLKQFSLASLVGTLLEIGRRFDLTLRPELLLLQRGLIHLESLLRSLDPELSLAEVLATQRTPQALYCELVEHALSSLLQAPFQ